MREGLYESIITTELATRLQGLADLSPHELAVDPADEPHVVAQHVASVVQRHLEGIRDRDQRVLTVNAVLGALDPSASIEPPVRQLLSLVPDDPAVGSSRFELRPKTPLAEAALLTNARDEPSLASEIKAEMSSADSVDLLCAFVRWHGVRLLEDRLRQLRRDGIRFRVVTTTYLGSTERRALDRLAEEFGAEIRVQYDAQRTRLHAKAWLFRRQTGFDTAYVGSSNLSRAALLDGVEWNVRLSQVATPSLLQKFEATFDSYWHDASFEPYDPERDRDRLDDALLEASGRKQYDRVTLTLSGLEVRPYAYQQKILDDLSVERSVHDRHRNLVVAATGTGKTVIAALDYRRLAGGKRPSLLFVAHRREILDQSLRTYREVLSDGDFGETWYAGTRPERGEQVFASIQSLNAYGISHIPPDAFDVVVIDEFHHAEAPSYRRLLGHLRPGELLGMTATPERADGTDVRDFFDGRIASELRLWDALESDLLCPFHYFAVADNTDLSSISWRRGRYDDAELDRVYTGNDARAAIVLRELRDKIADLGAMRALGFCVSVAHAHYMAQVFARAGIAAAAVSAETPAAERQHALSDLRARRVNVLFAVDLFNEGLDIPDVDTVLFLRPTESATVFLQQFGRGLRRTQDKAVLTALDFVGHHRKEFRWDVKLRALTGRARGELVRDIEQSFPFLPSGCQIVLDRTAQQTILDNVKAQVSRRWPQVVQDLRSIGDTTLADFLARSGLPLSDVLRSGSKSWTGLRLDAGLPVRLREDYAPKLLKRGRALAHVDDPDRAGAYLRLLRDDAPDYADLGESDQRFARMLFFSLWPDGGSFPSYDAGLRALRREEAVRDELSGIIELALDATSHVTTPLTGSLAPYPLRVHGRYQREEMLAAVDYATLKRKPTSMMQGVAYAPAANADLLMATLKKSEAEYSPTTMYRDYPISPSLFHWESQNATTVASPTGQRYLSGTSNVLLFVRETAQNPLGTAPYLFLGPATYSSHEGERPIAITWKLAHPLPADFFQAATVAVQ
ncbi:DUF3427 domain-containing protein [Nocardioides sp. dk4132]|uniref:DUF3427 domain-containing protein n=1 Tax=unclassified Nocardioides TaxID=2615069 RepID=UPI001295DFA2|nr:MULTISPECIES: DEAD/DEAH box helicase [unclassified Nocardioides]MQW76076.1 DUF3427 domain-containing protein [Nocardioides sp. dk4132]QGA08924.1 DUF3427 domain-containing protein [Nocardioides sp. dk884]